MADGELSEEDVSALLRLRVMLCIPQQIVEAAHSDICGSLFEKVIMCLPFLFIGYINSCQRTYVSRYLKV